jgi:hypothetical protein
VRNCEQKYRHNAGDWAVCRSAWTSASPGAAEVAEMKGEKDSVWRISGM